MAAVHTRQESLESLATTDRSSRKSGDSDGKSEYDDAWSESDSDHAHLLHNQAGTSADDLEAQTRRPSPTEPDPTSQPVEYTVPTSKKLFFLGLYFAFNLGLTLSNKALLGHAKFPWLLTFAHTIATSIGCATMLAAGRLKLTKLSTRDNLTLAAFSILFTLNIATSNISLAAVSVPFHQVMRSTCPVVTILIYRVVYSRTYSRATYLSMIPLIFGVALATLGSYSFTPTGFFLTLLGVVLASVKTVATNRLMTGTLRLSAMELLLRMSPLAALQCLVYAFFSGEMRTLAASLSTSAEEATEPSTAAITLTPLFLLGLLANATMAFALNGVSFQTNKVAGALTMSVCGNLKQCITILLGILLFSVRVRPVNGAGMVIALAGAAWYSKVELERKKAAGAKEAPAPVAAEQTTGSSVMNGAEVREEKAQPQQHPSGTTSAS